MTTATLNTTPQTISPPSFSPPATTGITSTMTAALATAIATLQNLIATYGSLDNLSLTQLRVAIAAIETAYNVYLAGLQSPAGINLDAPQGASTLDGYKDFATEAGLVATESDVQTALFYIQRIISNLMMAGG